MFSTLPFIMLLNMDVPHLLKCLQWFSTVCEFTTCSTDLRSFIMYPLANFSDSSYPIYTGLLLLHKHVILFAHVLSIWIILSLAQWETIQLRYHVTYPIFLPNQKQESLRFYHSTLCISHRTCHSILTKKSSEGIMSHLISRM